VRPALIDSYICVALVLAVTAAIASTPHAVELAKVMLIGTASAELRASAAAIGEAQEDAVPP
jgi:hypothetical protein